MARVFISYRRADGAAWVGWLAERLTQLDGVDDVQTAFHDDQLRAGDDFPTALENELSDSDLVIAMIGPHWRGVREDGSLRIQDEDDWIVRELSTSLRTGTRILPILVDGEQHPMASEVHPSIAELSRLHAVPFRERSELDRIEDHIQSHLREIDRQRAQRAGLAEPVGIPEFPQPLATGLIALAAAVLVAILEIVMLATAPDSLAGAEGLKFFFVLEVTRGTFTAVVAVLGVGLVRRIALVATFQWSRVATGVVPVVIFVPLAALNFVNTPSAVSWHFWIQVSLILILLVPSTVAVIAIRLSSPREAETDLATRARYIRVLRICRRQGAALLSLAASLSVSTQVTLNFLSEELGLERFNALQTMSLAVLVSGFMFGVYALTDARLKSFEYDLSQDLATLPQEFRDNAGLVHDPREPWIIGTAIALPLVVALIPTIWIVVT